MDSLTLHVNEVLMVSGRSVVEKLYPEMRLRQDLGMDSLELAELTVRLEAAYGVDIFKNGLVATVGEVAELLNAGQE